MDKTEITKVMSVIENAKMPDWIYAIYLPILVFGFSLSVFSMGMILVNILHFDAPIEKVRYLILFLSGFALITADIKLCELSVYHDTMRLLRVYQPSVTSIELVIKCTPYGERTIKFDALKDWVANSE
ncbi:hypothetical protein [Shewanella sp. 4_MG-2023]|uniref:hypothetical protein n=1 Tax=Shewanella sp. 4_MG-2023 TaxID=3062652 RepID=UPI0026E1243B|nr:hypothetical protein [Shewanella sp. 4_MG-2023]MDO6677082.1 hypothetical protein [Shewanella sp. 4_MG-2023]